MCGGGEVGCLVQEILPSFGFIRSSESQADKRAVVKLRPRLLSFRCSLSVIFVRMQAKKIVAGGHV